MQAAYEVMSLKNLSEQITGPQDAFPLNDLCGLSALPFFSFHVFLANYKMLQKLIEQHICSY